MVLWILPIHDFEKSLSYFQIAVVLTFNDVTAKNINAKLCTMFCKETLQFE